MSNNPLGAKYTARLHGVRAACRLLLEEKSATLHYPRHSRLGGLLRNGDDGNRAVLANYIRQEFGLCRAINNQFPVLFVGV